MSSPSGAGAAAEALGLPARQSFLDVHLELAKARLSGLVVATTVVGFLLAGRGSIDWVGLVWALLGTSLLVGGANGLNQVIEADRDSRMERTRRRPIPAGRVSPHYALGVSLAASAAGLVLLTFLANPLTGFLAFVAFFVYVAIYTPLKTRSPLCTLVGAVSGAIPPMMGWTAAAGGLDLGAWLLFTLLFVWQIPHFLALAWMCREDYARGGFVMLPLVDADGHATCRLVLMYSLFLLPVGVAFPLAGLAGWMYTLGSIVLGGGLLVLGVALYRRRTAANARRLFLASVLYLPLLLGLMIADRSSLVDHSRAAASVPGAATVVRRDSPAPAPVAADLAAQALPAQAIPADL